ncbi:unnamed protein product, partial [Heterotrigona itama]
IEIDRIMAHTYSSLSKSVQENQICPRHKRCASWEETTKLQELQAIRSMFDSPRSEFEASTLHAEPKIEKSLSTLDNLLESPPRGNLHKTPESFKGRPQVVSDFYRLKPSRWPCPPHVGRASGPFYTHRALPCCCPKGQLSFFIGLALKRVDQWKRDVKRNTCFSHVAQKYELYRLESGPSEKVTMNEEEAIYALRTMFYIRRMENKAAELYRLRLINGFLHLYAGQVGIYDHTEAIAVGMKMSISEKDSIITAYRCHAFAVVFGVPARRVFAELMGRKTGVSKGKGGSMHMYANQFYGGDGIVGGQVPIGAGLGFAQKYKGTGGVAWTFYGDGAASQGQVHEAYNMSKLWNLPVVYICENNKYAMGTSVDRHSANTNLYTRGDLIPGVRVRESEKQRRRLVDGMRVMDVREAMKFARDYALRNGPILLEMITYRYFGHSMSDPGVSYRTREEVKTIQTKRDPIELLIKLLVENGVKTEAEILEMRQSTYKVVDEEMKQAKADSYPEMSEIATDVYMKPLDKVRGKAPWEIY